MWRLAGVERIGEGLMWQQRAEERGRGLVDARGRRLVDARSDAAAEGKGGVEESGVRSEWDQVAGGRWRQVLWEAGEVGRRTG